MDKETVAREAWEDRLAKHEAAAAEGTSSEVEATPWLKFSELGASVTGQVVDFFENQEKGKTKRNVRMRDSDGNVAPMGLGGNLSSIITEEMRGHILHVVWVDNKEVGKQSPMKVFRVFDYGNTWPTDAELFPA